MNTKKNPCKRGHVDPIRSVHGQCLLCRKEYYKERYPLERQRRIRAAAERAKRDPAARRDQQRAQRLGVPVNEVRAIITRAAGKCEACERPLTHAQMCIDHDHVTGNIRGVLCRFCNALEGMLFKKKDRVTKLMAYVEKYGEQRVKASWVS